MTKLIGEGEAFVLCIFLINFARPNFHSVSESCWIRWQVPSMVNDFLLFVFHNWKCPWTKISNPRLRPFFPVVFCLLHSGQSQGYLQKNKNVFVTVPGLMSGSCSKSVVETGLICNRGGTVDARLRVPLLLYTGPMATELFCKCQILGSIMVN